MPAALPLGDPPDEFLAVGFSDYSVLNIGVAEQESNLHPPDYKSITLNSSVFADKG